MISRKNVSLFYSQKLVSKNRSKSSAVQQQASNFLKADEPKMVSAKIQVLSSKEF